MFRRVYIPSIRILQSLSPGAFRINGRHLTGVSLKSPGFSELHDSGCNSDTVPWHNMGMWGLTVGLMLMLTGRALKGETLRCEDDIGALVQPSSSKKDHIRHTPMDLLPLLEPSPENPIPVSLPPPMPGLAAHQWARHRFVAPIYGMPMCGKAYLAHELKRYIEFFHGAHAVVFDINAYLGQGGDDRLHADLLSFFEAEASDQVPEGAEQAIEQQVSPLSGSILGPPKPDSTNIGYKVVGGFAILTASDTVKCTGSMWSAHSKRNRRWMAKTLLKQLNAHVCFIEVSVDKESDTFNYMEQLGQRRGKSLEEVEEAVAEFSDHYVPLQMDGSESNTPYIKIMNYNEAMIVNRMMQSFVGSRVCQFLSNVHPYQHTIFLSRHGESEYNVEGRLGGDSSLSSRGREYARRVGEFSKFVVSGRATNLVCVTLSSQEVLSLSERLTKLPTRLPDGGPGLYPKGSWAEYGDTSGAVVRDGMRLVRLQPGFGKDFVDAPHTAREVQAMIGPGPATLVFVEGDVSEAGETPARLWTSSLTRTIETAAFIPHPIITDSNGKPFHQMARRTFRGLDEVYAGVYDGLTEKEIKKRDPQVILDRKRDKLGFRYPRGESYYDIIARLDDVMTNLQRIREPILIVSHQAVLRLVLGWLTEVSRKESLGLTFPQHTVVQISFDGLGATRGYIEYKLGPGKKFNDGQDNL